MGIDVGTPPLDNPKTRDAVQRMVEARRQAGKFGVPVAPTSEVAAYKEMGPQLLIGGADAWFIRTSPAESLAGLKRAIGR